VTGRQRHHRTGGEVVRDRIEIGQHERSLLVRLAVVEVRRNDGSWASWLASRAPKSVSLDSIRRLARAQPMIAGSDA
jgi:hypothetical protein